MPSIRQVAEHAGVSISTVSRVLNNAKVHPRTRERVLAVANRAGYVAAVGKRVTTHIGFAYMGEPTLSHPYDSAVLAGVARGTDEHNFDVVVVNIKRDKRSDESYTQFFVRKGVRGVILRTMEESRAACMAIADEGFPHVVVSERYDAPHVNYIDGESRPESLRAIEYLISLGHRRIAFGVHNVPDRDHLDRFEGYCEALARNGLEFDERLVFRQKYNLAGGATIMSLITNMKDRPTAIYFADPMLGVGAVKRALQMGVRIPEDLSVIGFDDTDLRHGVHPTLTAVCQDASALGYEAAAYLTRILNGQTKEALRKTLPTFLEVHESTAPPPNGSNGRRAPH